LKLYNVYHKLTDKVEIRYDMPVLSVNGNELATQIKREIFKNWLTKQNLPCALHTKYTQNKVVQKA
jgi:hypothetical protein